MKQIRFSLTFAMIIVLTGIGLMPTVRPAIAQSSSTTVTSAVFSIYVTGISEHTVNVHRITAPWNENTVTWTSFGSSFAPVVVGSFVPDTVGWHSVDVTSLVQSWHDGSTPNYGLAREEGNTPFVYSTYNASEFVTPELRPKLDVTYTTTGGPPVTTSYTLQRPNGTVNDAYVWELNPTTNYNYEVLYSGTLTDSGVKYVLIHFERLPTAIQLQSLTARSSVAPELGLVLVAAVGAFGVVMLRRRRER